MIILKLSACTVLLLVEIGKTGEKAGLGKTIKTSV